jgi:formate dehydrogenase major subunit
VPGLGVSFGRGGATTFQQDLQNSDCIVIEGSNFAECHPVGFQWVMEAKKKGATIIHVDPRFTRTSAMADMHVPIRAGTDIAFLGGLINYVLQNDLWFKDYVLNYTNAAALISENFRDTEDLDGIFSGYNEQTRTYDLGTWQYQRGPAGGSANAQGQAYNARFDASFQQQALSTVPGPVKEDRTLQDPHTVFQILKRHYSRYTPQMVSEVTGVPEDLFLKVAKAITSNSGRDRTTAWAYAVGWTQHTVGVQYIRTAGVLQLLLGNIGRPGGGIMALRGHATIQGSTDVPTLYNLLPGYLNAPTLLKNHDTLRQYLLTETEPTDYWSNRSKFMVSMLKAWYGDAATPDNDFAYDYLPKAIGDHSHMPLFVAMNDGVIKGFMAVGQNPAVGGQNARFQRGALAKLDWMVVRDLYLTETATFWHDSPEVKSGQLKPADIKTEVFFLPAASAAEGSASFTNTQRLLQWHEKAADPPGDARTDIWFTYHLGLRLKKLYQGSTDPKDRPILDMTWDYVADAPEPGSRIQDEPDTLKILKEVNGYTVKDKKLLAGFAALQDDGSTACGVWIYSGVLPDDKTNKAAARKLSPSNYVNPDWGYAWPNNRHILYNRASADPDGNPWSERKKYVWWDATAKTWTGLDTPDFVLTKAPDTPGKPDGFGLDYQSGKDPFILKPDGKGWLFAPTGLVDGPIPTHYEPWESPVGENRMYRKAKSNPALKLFEPSGDAARGSPDKFPYVITTYRLTEHHLSGVMSRNLPWLAELQPELFVEMSPELAHEKGIANTDWVTVSTPRGLVHAKALVTRRMRPLHMGDQLVHQVGMPWHWGYQGVVTGDVVNNLSAMVADPNVSIHESKAFICNVEKGRRA